MNVSATFAKVALHNADDLVTRHAPLVKRIAYHLAGRLPACVQPDDLIQAGMIGLLEAARNYDVTQGASFETYARIRIRGAMLDEVRRNDWTPRSVHRKARAVAHAISKAEHIKGGAAQDQDIAELLGVGLDEYHQILQDIVTHRVLSFNDAGVDENSLAEELLDVKADPLQRLESRDLAGELGRAIERLPDREQLVLALYYDEELNLREIGEVLGVSESRVCQIHGQALLRLRSYLSGNREEPEQQ